MCKELSVFLALALLSGCAASGPTFSSGPHLMPGKSGLYIYRSNNLLEGRIVKNDIYLDGKNIGKLANGGYLYVPAAPGPHTLQVTNKILFSDNGSKMSLTLRPKQVAYYKIGVQWGGSYTVAGGASLPAGTMVFIRVPGAIAINELRALHYLN